MIDIFIRILPVTFFVIASSITPGPSNLMLAASGANFGYKKSIPLLIGISLGFFSFLVATSFGINILIEKYPSFYYILKVSGSVYLVYLGIKIIRSTLSDDRVKILNFKEAVFFQYINPKVWGMALTAISSFSLPGEEHLISSLMISFWFFVVYVPCGFSWIVFGAFLQKYFLKNPVAQKVFNVIMGGTLIVLSIFLYVG